VKQLGQIRLSDPDIIAPTSAPMGDQKLPASWLGWSLASGLWCLESALDFLSYPFDTVSSHRQRQEVLVTSHEVYVSLFWIVLGGYVTYLGWTLYHITAERAARARHPSSLPHGVGEMSRYETEGALPGDSCDLSASPRSLVEFLFD
jgi:hypothetical protein